MAIASLFATEQRSAFEGVWVLCFNGKNLFKLTLTKEHGRVTGSLTRPIKLTIGQDGDVQDIGPDQVTLPVQKAKLHSGRLELIIGGDAFIMTVDERDRALLVPPGMRPWTLERLDPGGAVVLATSLSEPDYPPEIRALRRQLRAMVKEDQDARLAFDETRFAAADEGNRPEVLRIFSKHGWVTYPLAGNITTMSA